MEAQFDIETFNHIRNEYKTVNGHWQEIFIVCFYTKKYGCRKIVMLVRI